MDALVVHHHETGLKGRNRDFFEEMLARNIRTALAGSGYSRLRRGMGRITVEFEDGGPLAESAARVARLFGVAYVGVARRIQPEMDAMKSVGLEMLQAAPFEKFRVQARRTHTNFPERSQVIHNEVGRHLQQATDGAVDLKHADATIWIELFGQHGYVYRDRLEGTGGLPSGTSGKMICLLSGGIDSPVAAWRMARRGARVELLHFHGQPYTDPSSARQAEDLAEVLNRYHVETTLHMVPLGDTQREIVMNCPSDLRVLLYRRMMMRIATRLARQREAKALITGDALGQVASQTIENIHAVDAAIPGVPIMRPLIGMTKQEIIETAKQIGTYEISTRKHQDCCVLFEPRSPATRARPKDLEQAESSVDVDELAGKSLAGLETRRLSLLPFS